MTFNIRTTSPQPDYELIDSGEGEKLERYGNIKIARPDPQALWHKQLPKKEWDSCDATFSRDKDRAKWNIHSSVPASWNIDLAGLTFKIKLSAFKHTGIFPEQVSNWQQIRETVRVENRPVTVLNLFGYTGGATLAAAQAGAHVVHVDSSKVAITWARENAELSGLASKPIRWILDDVRAFVKREIKRGNQYDAIIMDPPAFGHGAKREVWKIENDMLPLLESCKKILSADPLFFLINGYAAGYSAIAYENNLNELMKGFNGSVDIGELAIEESNDDRRKLPSGIFAEWKSV